MCAFFCERCDDFFYYLCYIYPHIHIHLIYMICIVSETIHIHTKKPKKEEKIKK